MVKKFDMWQLIKYGQDMKWTNAVGKIAMIDLLDTGLPQI